MGLYRMGPPEDLILALQQRLQAGDFVETGTYRGDTAAWAARHFARVTTIELSPEYCAAAQARFRDQPAVRVLGGDSAAVLAATVAALPGPAFFWLDAHWSGLDTAGRETECPLLAELDLLNAAPVTHVVLVDDARLFCAPPRHPHRAELWPDLATTVARLHAGGRRHVVLFEDVLIAVPAGERQFLNRWLQDRITATPTEGRLARWWRKLRA
ncbi:MAG TPA: hypothetical protein VG734_18710 [Lacunisphaera sp.]|nr:hypothetical protein [Lacunisphaera sp.]